MSNTTITATTTWDDGSPVYTVGLALSGAISAGAYSAGVFDFLIEALDQWERHRDEPAVPGHRVVIAALSGSSAGAITGAVGMAAAARLATGAAVTGEAGEARHLLPDLYRTWVVSPDFTRSPEGPLLGRADLADPAKAVVSLLDSTALMSIGKAAIAGVASKAAKATPKPYLGEPMHVFLTNTNLRGVPYTITFAGAGGGTGYAMTDHADRTHFALSGIGGLGVAAPWAATDAAVSLPVASLPDAPPEEDQPWGRYVTSALASGAFPIGLAARTVGWETAAYAGRNWPVPMPAGLTVTPDWAPTPKPVEVVRFAAVDGGMLDNDPFQIAHYAVTVPEGAAMIAGGIRPVRSSVVMISPFPATSDYTVDDRRGTDTALLAVIARLIPVFEDQARFKVDQLVAALDTDNDERWMISPRRYDAKGTTPERYPIACGLLGGFGGFLDRDFREHDYELGRRNAQEFLARWFGYADGPDGSRPLPQVPEATSLRQHARPHRALIPLCGSARTPVAVRPWPRVGMDRVDRLVDMAMKRADALIPRAADQLAGTTGAILRRLVWPMLARSKVANLIRYQTLADLVRRDQLADPRVIPLDAGDRQVLAACIDPDWDFRSLDGLAGALHVEETRVKAAIDRLVAAGLVAAVSGVRSGGPVYCYAARVPAGFTSLWGGIRQAVETGLGVVASWIGGVKPAAWTVG